MKKNSNRRFSFLYGRSRRRREEERKLIKRPNYVFFYSST